MRACVCVLPSRFRHLVNFTRTFEYMRVQGCVCACVCIKRVPGSSQIHSDIISDEKKTFLRIFGKHMTDGQTDRPTDRNAWRHLKTSFPWALEWVSVRAKPAVPRKWVSSANEWTSKWRIKEPRTLCADLIVMLPEMQLTSRPTDQPMVQLTHQFTKIEAHILVWTWSKLHNALQMKKRKTKRFFFQDKIWFLRACLCLHVSNEYSLLYYVIVDCTIFLPCWRSTVGKEIYNMQLPHFLWFSLDSMSAATNVSGMVRVWARLYDSRITNENNILTDPNVSSISRGFVSS